MTISDAELETHYAAALTQYQGQDQELSTSDFVAILLKKMNAMLEEIGKGFSASTSQNNVSNMNLFIFSCFIIVTAAAITLSIFIWIAHKRGKKPVLVSKISIPKDVEISYFEAMKQQDFRLLMRRCVQILSENSQLNSRTLREILFSQNGSRILNEADKRSISLYSQVLHTDKAVTFEEWKAFEETLSRNFAHWHAEFQQRIHISQKKILNENRQK